jgi:uncharacterized protein (DUF1800 family)
LPTFPVMESTAMSVKRLVQVFVALVMLLTSPHFAGAADNEWKREDAAHLLRRAAFGGTPAQIDALHAMGREAAVDYLLSGKSPEGTSAVFDPVELPQFNLEPIEAEKGKDARKQAIQQGRADLQRYRTYWVDRMLRTDRPLEEKMSLFWHGLLTSGLQEVKYGHFLIQQNQLFHREALGNYKKLIAAIVHDPAMLRYLDADKNVVGKPNENLARELMELFTMGEGQGYTEKDISEVARALTGLAVIQDRGATFRKNKHDDGNKTIFGKTGQYGPDDVVELIFERPQPPRYLAKRLWEFFGHSSPTEEEIAPIAAALRQHKFELKPALRALFTSPAFYGEKSKFAMVKSPVDLMVGTMRLLEQTPVAPPIAQAVRQMGQELFQPPNVRGWPGGEQWITAATLYTRYNVCASMVEGDVRAGAAGMRDRPNKVKPEQPKKKPAEVGARIGNIRQAGRRLAMALVGESPEKVKQQERARAAREERMRQKQRERQQEKKRAGDDRPAPVSPAALFPKLAATPTTEQVVDAAVERFLQRPLHPEKRAALVETLGQGTIKLGSREGDQRVRDMLSLLLSTPEYQVH